MDLRHALRALPKFRRGALALFAIVAATSILLADQAVAQALLLTPREVLAGRAVWQPVTANFLYPDGTLGLLLGTLAVQWFAGSELERFWGTRRYLALVLGCAIVGHAASVALAPFVPLVAATTVGGATAIDMAALTAFAVVFGKRPLGVLPLDSRTLVVLVLVFGLVSPLLRGAPWPVVVPWLVAIAGALLVTTQPWRKLTGSGKLGSRRRRTSRRSHLRVVTPDPELLN